MRKSLPIVFSALLGIVGIQTTAAQQRIEVEAGQNTLLEAAAGAQPNDTLVLTTSGGAYFIDEKLLVEMPLTIMAAPDLAEKPVLSHNGDAGTKDIIRMYDDLTLIGLEFDGMADEGVSTKYAIRNSTGSDQDQVKQGYVLKIIDCYFHDLIAGSDGNAFRAYSNTLADSIIVRNSMFRNTGKQAIRVRDEDSDRPGFGFVNVNYFEVSNSTFSEIRDDAISVYGGDDDPSTPGPEVVIKNVTMYNVGHYLINLKDVEDATITNTILVNNYDIVNGTNKTLGAPWLVTGARLAYSDTLNISDDGAWTGSRADITVEYLLAVDPMFVEPDSGDFTLMDGSPLIGAGENGVSMGDPRWWPEGTTAPTPPMVHMIAAGQNALLDAVNEANAGDTIELTDAGGKYMNDSNINVTVPLTIRAAAGLATRPVIANNEVDESTRVVFDIFDSLHLDGIEIDGQAGTDFNAKYLLRIRHGSSESVKTSTVLKVTNSFLHDVIAGSDGNFLRQYTETLVDSIIVRNSILSGSGKEGLRIKDESSERPNMGFYNVGYFEVSNTTMYDTRQAAIYVYGGDTDSATPEPEFIVDRLTCYNCGHGNGRAVWPRDIQAATVTNSIFANSKMDGDFSVRLYGDSKMDHNNFFMVSEVVLSGNSTSENQTDLDPMFSDPENNDYSLSGSSPLVTAGTDGLGIGDMRWIVVRDDIVDGETPEKDSMLGANYPNPFVSETSIPYAVSAPGRVTLEVFDLLGRRVAQVLDQVQTTGDYTVTLMMDEHAAGTYFYTLSVGDRSERRMLVLAR